MYGSSGPKSSIRFLNLNARSTGGTFLASSVSTPIAQVCEEINRCHRKQNPSVPSVSICDWERETKKKGWQSIVPSMNRNYHRWVLRSEKPKTGFSLGMEMKSFAVSQTLEYLVFRELKWEIFVNWEFKCWNWCITFKFFVFKGGSW